MKKVIFATACLVFSGCGTIEMTISKDPSISEDVKERISMCRGMGEGQTCQSGGCFDTDAAKLQNAFVNAEKCEFIELENYGPVLSCSMKSLNIEYCAENTVCKDWYTWEGSFTIPRCEELE
tara:strand:- start:733 stop:1098 length:366 start_codon:yes stop_codon:yes gene_type:complete